MNTSRRGFTLIELMVVIGIIGILAAVIVVGIQPAGQQSRDAKRQADLREVQTTLELYKNKYGRYPERCNSGSPWSGQVGSSYACTTATEPYILGATGRFFSEFMVNLPIDPKVVSGPQGYVYTTNTDGTVYKFMVKNTVESEKVTYEHPFKSCDVSYNFAVERGSPSMKNHIQACDPVNSITDNIRDGCDIAMCDRLYSANIYNAFPQDPPTYCRDGNTQFEKSYAVWGGLANADAGNNPGTMQYRVNVERRTEDVICRIP